MSFAECPRLFQRLLTALAVVLSFVLSFASRANAEFVCQSGLSYSWHPGAEEKEIKVDWGTISGAGVDEATAKAKLAEQRQKEMRRALESCQEKHESLSGCIARRFTSVAAVLQNASFTARRTLEEAISADCKRDQGKCSEPAAGEPQCSEIKKEQADQQEEPAAAAAAAEKDKGKKEQKKK